MKEFLLIAFICSLFLYHAAAHAETNIGSSMEDDIRKAQLIVANKPQPLAISYGPNGFIAGKTIKNTILKPPAIVTWRRNLGRILR